MTVLDVPTRHRWPRRVWVPALAGGLVIGLLLGFVLLRDRPAGRAAAGERPLLLRAAAALEARNPAPVRVPRPDEWLFVRTARDWVEGRDEDSDGWTRADYKLGAQLDGGKVRTYDDEGVPWTVARVFPDLVEAYEFYADLPDDPAAVRRALYELVDKHDLPGGRPECRTQHGCDAAVKAATKESWYRDSAVFFLVNRLLLVTAPPPAVAAKLYRALAGVPWVEEAGTVVDMTGKKTAAVRWRPPFRKTDVLVFTDTYHILLDAETYEYRGTLFMGETFSFRNDGIVGSDVILSAGFVDTVGEYPPITDRPEFPRVLHKAADRLATEPLEVPGSDQWRYRKAVRAWLDWPNKDREHWLGVDEPLRNGIEAVVFADLADVYAFYRQLPEDPEAAFKAIYAEVGDDDRVLSFTCHSPRTCEQIRKEGWARHAAAYELIQRLLYVTAPPPRVQATLFRAFPASTRAAKSRTSPARRRSRSPGCPRSTSVTASTCPAGSSF